MSYKNSEFEIDELKKGWKNSPHHPQGDHSLTRYLVPNSSISGTIPKDLYGTWYRNGPGDDNIHGTPLTHPIDGDGFVVSLSWDCSGKTLYQSRYVQSRQRVEEAQAKTILYRGQMGTNPPADKAKTGFRNPSNTNVYYWGEKVITCYETHPPHCLDPHQLTTLGIDKLKGALNKIKAVAPHFRIDPMTNTLVTCSLQPASFGPPPEQDVTGEISERLVPWIIFHEFDPKWNLTKQLTLTIPNFNYCHDLLVTPNFYIVQISPFVIANMQQTLDIMQGHLAPSDVMKYYPEVPCQFAIISRTENGTKLLNGKQYELVDIFPCHIYHFGTGFESKVTSNSIQFKLSAVCLDKKFNMVDPKSVSLNNVDESPGRLYSFTIDLHSEQKPQCKWSLAHSASCEFPTVHPYFHGKSGRYVYIMASVNPDKPAPYCDVVKVDIENPNASQVWQSDGVVGEPIFAPRRQPSGVQSDEDDGYVLVQVYHPKQHLTDFCILDAKNISKGPIATIHLFHNVPYGFHGTFTDRIASGFENFNHL